MIALSLIVMVLHLNAQTLPHLLNIWSEKNPIEKVYLHIDRENYYSGQDIWFKAYFIADFLPSYSSSSIYVELIDGKGNVKKREVFPVFLGVAQGQIGIDTTNTSGVYTIRAYSPVMLNQSNFLFTQRIKISGKKAEIISKSKVGKLHLDFFPEGGNFIEGLMNNVAFKANDENGVPVNVSVTIKNQRDEIVLQTESFHDGMGSFSILPKKGEQYYAIIGGQHYPLPLSTNKGINLQLKSFTGKIQFLIDQQGNDSVFKPSYMLGQMQNRVVFRQGFKADKTKFSGIIQTGSLPSGILQITIFNIDNMPLAERLVFVNNKEYMLPAEITFDTLNTHKRMYNKFNLQLRDTVNGNFSISVTDADFENAQPREQNIYSWFLLNSDLKGYIHRPSWYFNNTSDSIEKALDLVMMTNGWRRFKWLDVANNIFPKTKIKDNGFIKLSGSATIGGTKKPFAEKELLLIISSKDTLNKTRRYTQILTTDAQGKFFIDSLVFYGNSNLLFSDVKGNNGRVIKVKLDGDSLMQSYEIPWNENWNDLPIKEEEEVLQEKMSLAYEQDLKNIDKTLETVTVTGKLKPRLKELDEYYTRGLFSGGIMARGIDLSQEGITGALNIFEFLQSRVPGIDVVKIDAYHVFYRKPVVLRVFNAQPGEKVPESVLGSVPNEMNLFLDEMPVSIEHLTTIPISNLAYMKIFPTFTGSAGGGGDGTIAVYTKKDFEVNKNIGPNFNMVSYRGYSISKEFYAADYSNLKTVNGREDNRLTLLWQQNLYINEVNAKIPIHFYNNDRTKTFKIVIEGVTNEGKLLMLETTVR